jgi:hypothetical protein
VRTSTERLVPHRTPRRTAEIAVAGVSLAVSTVFLGGFAAVVGRADAASFERDVLPALAQAGIVLAGASGAGAADPADAAYEAARTLAAWFGFTFVAVLAATVVGIVVARDRPWRAAGGVWFLVAGLVCLVGSQLILYPVAFGFFVAAALFAVRRFPPPEDPGRTRRTREGRPSPARAHSTRVPSSTGVRR